MAGVSGGSEKYDVHLNLAPVVDCMIVLISFLLLGASFLSITFLQTTVPAVVLEAKARSAQEKDKFRLTMILGSKTLYLQKEEEGKRIKTWKFDRDKASGNFPVETVHRALVAIKEKNPDRFTIDFDLKGEIAYGELISIIDQTKNLFKTDPKISLLDKKKNEEVALTELFSDIHWTGLTQ